jgi:hypothetical protein
VRRALDIPAYLNTEKRSEALQRVRSGKSPRDVAATLNVHLSTVYNWLKDPKARSAAQKRRAETDFVFCGESGRPFSKDGLQSAMKRLDPGFKFRELSPKPQPMQTTMSWAIKRRCLRPISAPRVSHRFGDGQPAI